MGTLAYIILKLAGFIEHDDDLINLCRLLSVDSITLVLLLQWWKPRRRAD